MKTRKWLLVLFVVLGAAALGTSLATAGQGENVEFVGHWAGEAVNVTVSGNYAYVASGQAGLRIIDVSDPAAPVEVGRLTEIPAFAVAVQGDYAYVAAQYAGLLILDVSNPTAPVEVGRFAEILGGAVDVDVSGMLAYVASHGVFSSGFQVIDVSDPTTPRGIHATEMVAWAVVVQGDYAYVASGDGGLVVFDVSDPDATTIVGSLDTPGWAGEVDVEGAYIYVADDEGGLRMIEILDSAILVERGFYQTPDKAKGVVVEGNYAYVADRYGGLRVLDISNPNNIFEVGFFSLSEGDRGIPFRVDIENGLVYLAALDGGLYILRSTPEPTPTRPPEPTRPRPSPTPCLGGIRGYIRIAGGGGITGWQVDLFDPARNQIATRITDADGYFEFIPLRAGFFYTVEPEARPGWTVHPPVYPVIVTCMSRPQVDFTVHPPTIFLPLVMRERVGSPPTRLPEVTPTRKLEPTPTRQTPTRQPEGNR